VARDINVRHDVVNTGVNSVSPAVVPQLVATATSQVSPRSIPRSLALPSTEAKMPKVVQDIENNKVDVEKQASNGYVAMVQHYFASAWILADGIQRDLFAWVDTNLYAVGMITSLNAIAPAPPNQLMRPCLSVHRKRKKAQALAPGLGGRDYGWLTILPFTGYWTSCTALSITGAGPSWRWCCCKIAFYWLNAKLTRAWPR
jgi:YidC/Oxa1 family membrane protein insertase